MKQINPLPNIRQGFTLVELMIVLAVIAILIATFTVSFSSIFNQENATAMESAANKIRNAVYNYAQDNGQFPSSLNSLTSPYNYLRNMTLDSNGDFIVNNVGSIGYDNNTVSPCSRQSLILQFNNSSVCQEVANDFQHGGVLFSNNCSSNSINLCL